MLATIALSLTFASVAPTGGPVEVSGGLGRGITIASADDGADSFAVTARLRLQ